MFDLSFEIWYTDVIYHAESNGVFVSCMVSKLRTFEFCSYTNVLKGQKIELRPFFFKLHPGLTILTGSYHTNYELNIISGY